MAFSETIHLLLILFIFSASFQLILRYLTDDIEQKYFIFGLHGMCYVGGRLAFDWFSDRKEVHHVH